MVEPVHWNELMNQIFVVENVDPWVRQPSYYGLHDSNTKIGEIPPLVDVVTCGALPAIDASICVRDTGVRR